MPNGHNRRRFIQIAGTGAAASLAGCSALGNLTDEDADADADSLTVLVGPDQEAIDEIIEDIEDEEIDPIEAQQRQAELIEDAVADFEERADEEDDLAIEESTAEMGLFRIDADVDGELLIDVLRDGEVNSIHTGAAYDQILERQQQQQGPQGETPEDGDVEEGDLEDDESDDGDNGDGDSDNGDDDPDEDDEDADDDSETDDE